MASSDLFVGLAPALSVQDVVEFGPLRLTPVGKSNDVGLRAIAARYANERGAHPTHQAVITCSESLLSLVPTLWPLFVFACVSRARRRQRSGGGVAFAENFHLLAVFPNHGRLSFDTGHSIGFGGAEHLPLRWPVDGPIPLGEREWDLRIERACSVLASDPVAAAHNDVATAAGMAADLACAAMERRTQRVENVAASARAFILLASAFEALHYKGSPKEGTHRDVYLGVERLDVAARTELSEQMRTLLRRGKIPLLASDGEEKAKLVTRPTFAVAQLFYLRNVYAHGRAPEPSDVQLPAELNECSVLHAATLILALLVGDDLARAVNPAKALSGDLLHHADMLEALAEALIPDGRDADANQQ